MHLTCRASERGRWGILSKGVAFILCQSQIYALSIYSHQGWGPAHEPKWAPESRVAVIKEKAEVYRKAAQAAAVLDLAMLTQARTEPESQGGGGVAGDARNGRV